MTKNTSPNLIGTFIQMVLLVLIAICGMSLISGFCLWLPWTYFGIGPKYFHFMSESWQHPSLWDWVLIGFIVGTVKNWLGQIKIGKGV
jgi:hypothetical protein